MLFVESAGSNLSLVSSYVTMGRCQSSGVHNTFICDWHPRIRVDWSIRWLWSDFFIGPHCVTSDWCYVTGGEWDAAPARWHPPGVTRQVSSARCHPLRRQVRWKFWKSWKISDTRKRNKNAMMISHPPPPFLLWLNFVCLNIQMRWKPHGIDDRIFVTFTFQLFIWIMWNTSSFSIDSRRFSHSLICIW